MSDTSVSPGDIYMFYSSHSMETTYYIVLWKHETMPDAWDMMEIGRPELNHWERGSILTDTKYYLKVA